jgi:dTDP-glucose 4,6-dehydratase
LSEYIPERIVVTGGAGFIGSNFIHHLLHREGLASPEECCPDHHHYSIGDVQAGLQILNIDCLTYAGNLNNLKGIDDSPNYNFANIDIREADIIRETFQTFLPDTVVHFAAESHVDRSIESGYEFVSTNVLGTQILLDASREANVRRFIHVSTDEVYGSIEEGSFSEEGELRPSSPYSASKAGSDLLALSHHHTYGTPVIITRCTNNFGPRQHPEKLLPKMILRANAQESLPVFGTGLQIRDWLYVKDHCEAILTILSSGRLGEIYNIAAQDERTNLGVIREIVGLLDRAESLIEHVSDRPGHDFRYSIDDRKLREIGWKPKVDFETVLPEVINSVIKDLV